MDIAIGGTAGCPLVAGGGVGCAVALGGDLRGARERVATFGNVDRETGGVWFLDGVKGFNLLRFGEIG